MLFIERVLIIHEKEVRGWGFEINLCYVMTSHV